MINSGYLTSGTHYRYVSMDVWIRGYFEAERDPPAKRV